MQVPRSVLPPTLQLLQWVFYPLEYMEIYFQRFGDMFQVEVSPLNTETYVMVNHPEAVQYLFSHDQSDHLSVPGSVNLLAKPLLGDNSTILLDGAAHRQRRQLVLPPFHGEALKRYRQQIIEITTELWQTIPVGERFCVRDLTQAITMRVILQVVFGLHQGERYHQLEQALGERLDLISNPINSFFIFFPQLLVDLGDWSLAAQLKALIAKTDALLYAEIAERRAEADPSRQDVLSLMLQARDEQGEPLSDIELHDELVTLLIVGHETTATALAWAFYWIHHQPGVEATLRAELHQASQQTRERQPYLSAVCQETLRLYPIALTLLPRRVEKPFQLMGYDLEPNMLLLPSVYLIHQRPDFYPNPKQFRPERFLERQYPPSAFLPFGGGNRRCIGSALAMMELQQVITQILTTSQLALEPQTVKPERRGGTLAPSGGVWMRRLN
jgi:cytochrome P450 family 110